jgi:ubiquinone/menaquinone biosynthesis C-methylase UbiE
MKRLKTKDDVDRLLFSATASAALGTAIETGLLWMLAERPQDGISVIESLGIPGKRGFYWLQLLEKIGILVNGPEGYTPSNLALKVILETRSEDSWKHLILDDRERVAAVSNLALHIREPGSIWAAQGLPAPKNYVDKMRNNPARAREFTRMLFEVHQPLAKAVAELLDLTDVQNLMDLGGGSGVLSMGLLREYPALQATVVDIENVCIAGREIAVEEGLADRISYHPAEFDREEFPAGFDMVLQCDVGVFGVWLYKKLWQSLKPGGRLVFVEHLSPTENLAPPTRVEWTFLDSLEDPNFSMPTYAQVQHMLIQAGFQVLPGQHSFGSGWVVFQARKRASAST